MPRLQDARTVYAQSSDIKSRTYLAYRRDMKRKAIAELEALPWIEDRLREYFKAKVTVQKAGGDAFLWFLRAGGVTREPDYIAIIEGPEGTKTLKIEFQYADKADLKFYDFKISKVARKRRGAERREPLEDVLFVYIDKPTRRYAFLEPRWIVQHGEIGAVQAWGSRQAYRVPAPVFQQLLQEDPALPDLIRRIDIKTSLLSFQHAQIGLWQNVLKQELEQVIDEKQLLQWEPEHLNTFFRICFVLDHLDKAPLNAALWLGYATTYVETLSTLEESAFLTYVLDYLYGRIPVGNLRANEQKALVHAIERLRTFVLRHAQPDGSFTSSSHQAPLAETRYALFALNLLEDMTQDLIFYTQAPLSPIARIYQWVPDIERTYTFVIGKA